MKSYDMNRHFLKTLQYAYYVEYETFYESDYILYLIVPAHQTINQLLKFVCNSLQFMVFSVVPRALALIVNIIKSNWPL